CYGGEDGVQATGGGPVVQDAAGDMWVGGPTTLVRWKPGAARVYRPQLLQSNEGNEGIAALASAPDGSLWVGMGITGRGAGLQHMIKGVMTPFLAPSLNGETLEVLNLCLDHQDNLWIGTTHGIYKIRGTDADHFGSEEGLSSDFVTKVFEDREGNVWVATS